MKVKVTGYYPKTIDGEQIGPFSDGQIVELDFATAQKFIRSSMAVEVLPPVEEIPAE